jgi:PAS domain S-box-containing protein
MTVADFMAAEDATEFTRELLVHLGTATASFIYAKDINSRMVFANRAVLETLGKSWAEIRGKTDAEWHDNKHEGRALVAADARIMAAGITETLEEEVTTPDGPRTYLSTKSPLRAADGRVIGLFGISVDITARKEDERLRQLLVDELEHRVRNTLTLVRVMARQTLRKAGVDRTAWDAFDGRLQAMAQAHTILTRDSWQGADIRQIVAEMLAAQGADHAGRFDLAGPEIWIDAQNALALALALHELGTNALKYGALSVPDGRVRISWQADPSDMPPIFDLVWQESGGPVVQPPARVGFGSKLIEQAFGSGRRDAATVDYAPGGIVFKVRLALATQAVSA